MFLQRTGHFIWLNSWACLRTLRLSHYLQTDGYSPPPPGAAAPLRCAVAWLWLIAHALPSGSDGWEGAVCPSCRCLCDHRPNLFVLARRRVCRWGDMTKNLSDTREGSAPVTSKGHFASKSCGRPVCARGLTPWNRHPPSSLLPPVLTCTCSHQCGVHNTDPGVFTWLCASYCIHCIKQ